MVTLFDVIYVMIHRIHRALTTIWASSDGHQRHPNISSQTGDICRDLLKNNWSPAITLRSALICLQVLLLVPEPKHPQDAFIAKQCLIFPPLQYLTDHAAFTATAWHWTKDFAMVSSAEYNRNSTRPLGSSESDIRINSSAHSFAPSCMPAIVRGQQEQLYPDVYKQNPMTKANIFGNADAIETVNTRQPLQALLILYPYSDESSGLRNGQQLRRANAATASQQLQLQLLEPFGVKVNVEKALDSFLKGEEGAL
ncbi:ubiquitin-conjugating enzyme E2 27 [Tanacetum coccineum]